MKPVVKYVVNVAVGADQLVNAILLGDPAETVSSRMGKAIAAGRCHACRPVCWLLGLIQKDHCARSAAADAAAGAEEVMPL